MRRGVGPGARGGRASHCASAPPAGPPASLAVPSTPRVRHHHPTTTIAVISDTHLPRGGRRLPAACVARLKRADLIIHAGDLTTIEALDELHSYGRVLAVHGNQDDAEVRATLPATVSAAIGSAGIQLAVIHDAGPARGRLERLRRRFPEAAAVIFGHSHIPLHEAASDGFQTFNPGSPTERRRAKSHTMGLAHLDGQRISFRLITLD